MDTLNNDRKIIRAILNDFATIPYAGETGLRSQAIFDDEGDHYLLVTTGIDDEDRHIHYCVFHVDLIAGKFWIQHDATDRPIALELEAAGVPKDRIVLGFREPKIRPYTGYAVA
jgi:hypothetical protein